MISAGMKVYALILCGLLTACTAGEGDPAAPDAGVEASDAGPDLSEQIFDPNHVIDIEIDIGTVDWDDLRKQARSIFDVLGSSCLEAPPPSPFTYFPATVTIDGQQVENVGLRKKGFFGSLSETKPSLKIKFSEYIVGQRFSGLKRMTLNNNKSDVSHVKQCIGYALFAKAGVAAPRCSFARVTVNGEYLGVFTHVESIKKPFVARHFANAEGNLYEGALSDFREGWVETFQRKTNTAAVGQADDRSDIEALVPLLQLDDAGLVAALEARVDVDAFLDLWVMETIMMHADGYARNTNNFYLYGDPLSGLFHFIPWGIDSILFSNTTLPWEQVQPPESIFAEGTLARRLYQYAPTRARYLQRMEEHLASTWDENTILTEVDRMESLLEPHLLDGEAAGFAQAVEQVRSFVQARRGELRAELDASSPVTWDRELREPWCLSELGSVNADFSGQWTDDVDELSPFSAGTLSLTSTVPGAEGVNLGGGTTLGVDSNSANTVLRLVAIIEQAADPQTQSTVVLIVLITLGDEDLAPQSLMLDSTSNQTQVVRMTFPPGGADPVFEGLGIAGSGVLTLDQIGGNPGDPLSGSLETYLYALPF